MQRTHTAGPPEAHIAHVKAPDSRVEHGHGHSHSPLRAILLGIGALLLALLVLSLGYGVAHNGRVFRGVSVLGKDLGGLDRPGAVAALAQVAESYPTGEVALTGGDRTWKLSPSELGVALDVDSTVDAALGMGRQGDMLADFGKQLAMLTGGEQIKPILKYEAALVDKTVGRIAGELDKPAVNSKLEQGSDGKVIITDSAEGSVVDQEATRSALRAVLASTPFPAVRVQMREEQPKVVASVLRDSQTQALLLTEQDITLTSGKQSWTLKPEDLRKMLTLTASSQSDWNVTLDKEMLAAYLKPMGEALKVAPKDATVIINKGAVTLKPDVAGAQLDVQSAVAGIEKAATQSNPAERTVSLTTLEVPAAIHAAQLQELSSRATALVTQGIRLRFRDDGYILRGSSVTGFLDVAPDEGGAAPLKLVVDEDVLANRVSGVAYNINRPATDARYRLVNGAPAKVAPGQEGLKVNVAISTQNALKAIASYAGSDRLQVDLDVAVVKPNLLDADLGNITTPDLLGTGQTQFKISSPERAWNVTFGASKIDGTLVPPGGTFSTVDTIGDLTLEAGFKMGYAIMHTDKGLTTVPAEAGGICQVSTTLFHSVFWAGLPVVERNWHSYWIGLYGVAPSGLQGLDATIAPPEKDFRFKNTTGHWLLIKATVVDKVLTFQLYGVNPGWKVKVSGPVITNVVKTSQAPITEKSDQLPKGKTVQVEHAQDGFDSKISRTVTDASGKVIDQWTIKSSYAPAYNRTLVGTGK